MINSYYSKLCKTAKPSPLIKNLNAHYLLDEFIYNNDYICQFNYFWILDNLQLLIIKDVYDYITTGYQNYQKIMSPIT